MLTSDVLLSAAFRYTCSANFVYQDVLASPVARVLCGYMFLSPPSFRFKIKLKACHYCERWKREKGRGLR